MAGRGSLCRGTPSSQWTGEQPVDKSAGLMGQEKVGGKIEQETEREF